MPSLSETIHVGVRTGIAMAIYYVARINRRYTRSQSPEPLVTPPDNRTAWGGSGTNIWRDMSIRRLRDQNGWTAAVQIPHL